MVKGKVQPSEKYIYKSMMPYTNAQQFQSVQVKSSKDRHSLILQQVEAQQTQLNSINASKNANKKKLKGSKMARGENIKLLKKAAAASGSQTTRRKTVIMEMEEEYSGSDGEPNAASPNPKHESWQDL